MLATAVSAVEVKTAAQLGSFVWRNDAEWFGGFSALHLSEDGSKMLVLSDRAHLAQAEIDREGDTITSVRVVGHWPVLSTTGATLPGVSGDSEGIAVKPDGSFFISFEGVHRVAYYETPQSAARPLPRPRAFNGLNLNGSFEALAIDDQQRLYTLTEKSRTQQGDIPVYRWDGRSWSTPFVLPQRGKFLPVSADFGPDGRFYVLERALGWTGFRSRLRRWRIDGDLPTNEEVLFESRTGTHDNLEGLSIWRDDQQRLRATMISDDNFLALQRTELVEYLLPD